MPSPDRIEWKTTSASLGALLVAQSDQGLCAVLLDDDPGWLKQDLKSRFPFALLTEGDARLDAVAAQVVALIERPSRGLNLPLDARGTAFQQGVWRALRQIPCGHTTSYSDIALSLGMPKAARAIAQACAANPLAVAIPCHRVVGRDGKLSGYRWGLERKRELLRREAGEPT